MTIRRSKVSYYQQGLGWQTICCKKISSGRTCMTCGEKPKEKFHRLDGPIVLRNVTFFENNEKMEVRFQMGPLYIRENGRGEPYAEIASNDPNGRITYI